MQGPQTRAHQQVVDTGNALAGIAYAEDPIVGVPVHRKSDDWSSFAHETKLLGAVCTVSPISQKTYHFVERMLILFLRGVC